MNGATVAEDMESVEAGGIVLYDDSLPIANHRRMCSTSHAGQGNWSRPRTCPTTCSATWPTWSGVGVAAYLLENRWTRSRMRFVIGTSAARPKPIRS